MSDVKDKDGTPGEALGGTSGGPGDATPVTLVLAKFQVPGLPHWYVARPRLDAYLHEGLAWQTILLVAPEGFGKTILMAQWHQLLNGCPSASPIASTATAWLTLDQHDNDLKRLWAHLSDRLLTLVSDGEGQEPLPRSSSSQSDVGSLAYLEELSNELFLATGVISSKTQDDVAPRILFIDGLECLRLAAQEAVFSFFMQRLPSCVHVVVASSIRPRGIERLRFSDKVYDINAPLLMFTLPETIAFLNLTTDNSVSVERSAQIHQQTEGWIGGLKLAISVFGSSTEETSINKNGVDGFDDTDKRQSLAFDALVSVHQQGSLSVFFQDRVYEALSAPLEEFLLETAIMECFCPSLMDYVSQRADSRFLIDQLLAANSFITEDREQENNGERWYRYHPLFLAWLHERVLALHPDFIRDLNDRASKWFEVQGLSVQAGRHLLLASESELVEGLVASAGLKRPASSRSLTSFILDTASKDFLSSPLLSLYVAWAYICSGRPRDGRRWLETFQETVRAGGSDEGGIESSGKDSDSTESDNTAGSLPSIEFALKCAGLKCLSLEGEFVKTVKEVQRLLEDEASTLPASLQLILTHDLAEGYVRLGMPDAAREQYLKAEGMASLAGSSFVVAFCRYEFASLQLLSGRLDATRNTCYRALRDCPPDYTLYGGFYGLLARTQIETGDFDGATRSMKRAIRRLSQTRNPDFYLEAMITQVYLLAASGQLDEAYERMLQAVVVAEQTILPRGVLPLAYAVLAQLALLNVGYSEAEVILIKLRCCLDDQDVAGKLLLRSVEAQFLSATGQYDEAEDAYKGLADDLVKKGLVLYALDPLLAQSTLLFSLGDKGRSIRCLGKALELGARLGIASPFVIRYESIQPLLFELLEIRSTSNSLRVFTRHIQKMTDGRHQATHKGDTRQQRTTTLDLTLSKREIEILNLLGKGMSRAEIADTLSVSVNTVKSHITRIYQKLDVNSRREAVALADKAIGPVMGT
ncbi:MAG: LuxR C-terminal-related transcriptional regulator [Coriobacteriales bacterium]|jgi:LuxR family maltose regulon positive regulatory protein|nr:LuxR C-terminal-related transcriptional regulator [Coriobacteriales bacterium]